MTLMGYTVIIDKDPILHKKGSLYVQTPKYGANIQSGKIIIMGKDTYKSDIMQDLKDMGLTMDKMVGQKVLFNTQSIQLLPKELKEVVLKEYEVKDPIMIVVHEILALED